MQKEVQGPGCQSVFCVSLQELNPVGQAGSSLETVFAEVIWKFGYVFDTVIASSLLVSVLPVERHDGPLCLVTIM